MPKQVLVTGAYGFIGRHVARALGRHGAHVTAIGHGAWDRDEWRGWGIAEWHAADIEIETLVTYGGEPDVIFHCAGSGSVAFSMTHPAQDFHRSVGTTVSVLEFIRLYRPQARLVLPSSAGVYGIAHTQPITVESPLNPLSPYGLHKKFSEELCASAARNFRARVAIVRLFSIYGEGLRKQLIWDACRKLSAGETTFSGTGAETRDWLHVEDAAELMIAAADHASATCPVVNGGAGRAVTIAEVIGAIAEDLGRSDTPLFSGEGRPGDPTHYHADIAGALGWGWRPRRHWREDIRAYVAWYRAGAR